MSEKNAMNEIIIEWNVCHDDHDEVVTIVRKPVK